MKMIVRVEAENKGLLESVNTMKPQELDASCVEEWENKLQEFCTSL